LQEREFERIVGNRTIKVDVRVIATTNRNLEHSVEQKEFRQDLFYRLNVVPIRVAPLREHRDDVLLLKREFMQRFSRRHGIHTQGITNDARQALLNHSWPGNVRELQNVIERAVIMAGDNAMLEQLHLGLVAGNSSNSAAASLDHASKILEVSSPVLDLSTLAEMEKRHILRVLNHCQGNRTHAAKRLGISIRTIRNKLHEYGESLPPMEDEAVDTGP
jgi:DNA-binding NtrC family response regulator